MSIDCNPRVVMQDLMLYLDAGNTKSYPVTQGDIWYDISGNGNHFQMFGFVPKVGHYFSLAQSASDYFVSYELFAFASPTISVEMWCKPQATTNTYALWSFTSQVGTTIYQSVYDQENLVLSGPTGVNLLTGQNIVDDSWKHIVRTSTRVSADPLQAGKESLYVNGKLVFSAVASPNLDYNSPGVLLIGQKPNITGNLDSSSSFLGDVSIFKVYNKELSADEVNKNFNAIRGRYVL